MPQKTFKMVVSFTLALMAILIGVTANAQEINNQEKLKKIILLDRLITKRQMIDRYKAGQKQSIFNNKVLVTINNKEDLIIRTQKYFTTYFPNSPVNPAELVNLALVNNFPLDFIILNGHLESHMCTKGRGADSLNCHNVNNTDAGDYKSTICGQYTECLTNVYQGEIKFINLIKNCYMNIDQDITLQAWLDQDFRIQRTITPFCSANKGARYMTDTRSLSKYQYGIKNWINPIFEGYTKE